MKQSTKEIQIILEGAERRGDWATCFSTTCGTYSPYDNYHSISDLREILELRQEVEWFKLERDSVCHLNDDLSAELNQLREQSK